MRVPIWLLIAFPLALPAQEPGPVVRATATEVMLDFVARDKKAHLVRDLRPEEVQVLEDGVPQKLRHFEYFAGRTEAAPSALPTAQAAQAPAASVPARPRDVNELRDISVVSVVVGNLNPEGRKLTLAALREFFQNELRPNTYVGVFWAGDGFGVVQPYTNDAEAISAAVKLAVTRASRGPVRDGGDGEQTLPATATGPAAGPAAAIAALMSTEWVNELGDLYDSSARYLTGIRLLVQSQAAIPGRKVVLLFSAGIPMHPGTVELLKSSISSANRSNVTIYAVDTRGLVRSDLADSRRLLAAAAKASMAEQLKGVNGGDQTVTYDQAVSGQLATASLSANTRGNLAQLAEGTGGALLPNFDLREPLRRAMEEVRAHYELSYSPADTTTDGRFRKIEVKVSRPGVTVFARSGYYALPVLNGRPIQPFEVATLKAIQSKPLPRQFDFRDVALRFRPGPERTQFSFAFQVAGRDLSMVEDKEWATVHMAVTALIRDEQGQVVEKISRDIPYRVPAAKAPELRRGVVSFTSPFLLPPGRYTLETAALDRESMKVSVHRSNLAVGSGSGLAMSDLTLVRRVDPIQMPGNPADPLQARGGRMTPELSDTVSPEAGGELRFYAVAYPPTPLDAPLEVGLEITRAGQTFMRSPLSPVSPDQSGAAAVLVSVPAGKLPPGQYVARLTFRYRGQTVAGETAFGIGSGN
jgi:VWFA-related protein